MFPNRQAREKAKAAVVQAAAQAKRAERLDEWSEFFGEAGPASVLAVLNVGIGRVADEMRRLSSFRAAVQATIKRHPEKYGELLADMMAGEDAEEETTQEAAA